MVAISAICNCSKATSRDSPCLFIWRNNMLCLPFAVHVERSKINCSSRAAICLRHNMHPCLPCSRDTRWNRRNNPLRHVALQLLAHFFAIMDWNSSSSIRRLGDSLGVNMNSDRICFHHGKWLMWAYIERRTSKTIQKPSFHFLNIFFQWFKWQGCWSIWWL